VSLFNIGSCEEKECLIFEMKEKEKREKKRNNF
jgi:hypothetical protein